MSSRLAWAKEQVPDQLELFLDSRTLMSSKTKSKKTKKKFQKPSCARWSKMAIQHMGGEAKHKHSGAVSHTEVV